MHHLVLPEFAEMNTKFGRSLMKRGVLYKLPKNRIDVFKIFLVVTFVMLGLSLHATLWEAARLNVLSIQLTANFPRDVYSTELEDLCVASTNDSTWGDKEAPGPARFSRVWGTGCLLSGHYRAAISYFNRWLSHHSQDTVARFLLGNSYFCAGDTEAASNVWRTTNASVRFAKIARGCGYQGKFDAASAMYHLAITSSANPPVELYVKLGDIENARRRRDLAVEAYMEAVRLEPSNRNTHYKVGNTLRLGGRIDEALEYFEKASQLFPDMDAFPAAIARMLVDQGRFAEAIPWLNRALSLNPLEIEYHLKLAMVYEELGYLNEAEQEYMNVLELDPDELTARERLQSLIGHNNNK